MNRPAPPSARDDVAAAEIEGLAQSESAGGLPSAALAAHASGLAPLSRDRRATDREIWALSWPVIVSQVLASAVSLIDIAMVGRLGRQDVAAVGYATQYLNLTQAVLLALGAGCVAVMAQATGARNERRAREALAGSLALTIALSLAVTVAALALPRPLMRWLSAPAETVEAAVGYFRLTLGSTLLFGLAMTLESGFRAVGDTRTPLVIALLMTLIKTALNAVLIFGGLGFPRMELVGAGLATLISQIVGVALFVWAAQRREAPPAMRIRGADFRLEGGLLGELVRVSLPAVGERIVLQVAMMSYFAVLGRFGSAPVAAYTIGIRILSFSWIPGTAFAVAASTLVGQAIGAGDDRRAGRAGWRATLFSLAVSIPLGLLYAVAREPLARVFTPDESVVRELVPFMLVMALAQPLLGVHFTLGGALRGAADTVTPFFAALVGSWAFRVPIAYLAQPGRASVHWVYAALVLDYVARAAWLTWAFHRGKWRTRGSGTDPRGT